jgi:hypothetical protein
LAGESYKKEIGGGDHSAFNAWPEMLTAGKWAPSLFLLSPNPKIAKGRESMYASLDDQIGCFFITGIFLIAQVALTFLQKVTN